MPSSPSAIPKPRSGVLGGALLAAVALALLAVHWAFPRLAFDTPTLVLLAIAATPVLGQFLTSVKLPGGIELELAQLQEKVEDLGEQQAADEIVADRRARDNLLVSAAVAESVAALESMTGQASEASPGDTYDGTRGGDSEPLPRDVVAATLERLATGYDALRAQSSVNGSRTEAMTRITGAMAGAIVIGPEWNPSPWFAEESAGRRLAATVYLFVRPRAEGADALVDAILRPDAPAFNQYWAIRALAAVVDVGGVPGPHLLAALRAHASLLPPGGDRSRELARVLRRLPGGRNG
jgi:hypothetical protein